MDLAVESKVMKLPEADDLTLLRRIAAGNHQAMEALYHRHYRSIYTFALRRLQEAADAADVVNDVMMEAWTGAGRFEGRAQVRTWLLGIANFKIIDIIRKKCQRPTEEYDDQLCADDDSSDGIELLTAVENQVWVKRCLGQLKDIHAQIVHLAFYEELSYTEIAEILQCPPGTVKTRMMHAKQKLKRCMQAIA